jgi:hypothetical protein
MRSTFEVDSFGRVILSYNDIATGNRIRRFFVCQRDGGQVFEQVGGSRGIVVCERLKSSGPGLVARNRGELISLIRREYRKMRRAEKRFLDDQRGDK